jgi:hypothetical protein|tara:strand:+ start:394 stop:522 length:129 start_codon:yes stop_codon:yes gene_type:complete
MNKAQEKMSQLVYGALIGGLALGGLVILTKQKVVNKITGVFK